MNHFVFSRRLAGLGIGLFLAVFVSHSLGQDKAEDKAEGKAGVAADSPPPVNPSAPESAAVPNIFAVRTWAPPVEPAVVEAVRPKPPEAPQLPFRFIGKIADPDKSVAFLLGKEDQVMVVSVGDLIDGIYLVEKYEGAHLYFIYKPMKARQSLFVGGAS